MVRGLLVTVNALPDDRARVIGESCEEATPATREIRGGILIMAFYMGEQGKALLAEAQACINRLLQHMSCILKIAAIQIPASTPRQGVRQQGVDCQGAVQARYALREIAL